MAFQWRRFNFFNKQTATASTPGRTWPTIQQCNFTCSACGRGSLVFGDSQGFIHFVSNNFLVSSFRGYEFTTQHLFQLKQHNILAGVGIDEAGINPVIKVWNLDKKDKLGNPFCCRVQATIPSNNMPSVVTAFTLHESLTLMAVGFEEGSIVVYKGDVAKERSTNKVIHLSTESKDPVTGLSIHIVNKINYIFATTENCVMSFNLQEKLPKKRFLDSRGCPPHCSMMGDADLDNQFVVTATDAVYLYEHDSRGPCFIFEGEKVMARWFNGYLVLVYKDKAKSSVPSTSTMKLPDKNMVTLYDMKQKLIAYSSTLPGVQDVLYEWNSIYVLAADNALICLHEIDIREKLEMLFKKNLYSLAVSIAKSQELGAEGLVAIFTQYGDHLYSKADYDNAISQYTKTIGYLEPSYIIRKFLDAQRIHNLTSYLQALHERGHANEDHTTLLLNCFTKLKDVDNLNKFIMTPGTELHFDVETAIKVCRQAGYCQHALQLAEKHKKHKWYLKIQLEDTHDYAKALAYIKRLPFEEAEQTIVQYGKVLVNSVPEETTQLLKRLCTDYKPTTDEVVDENPFSSLDVKSRRASGEKFIHIFVNSPNMLVDFLEHLVKVHGNTSETVYTTLLELYLHKMARTSDTREKTKLQESTLELLKDFTSKGYNTDQALVLCQTLCFPPGILYLYEAAGLYQQILRYHMDHQLHGMVVETCRLYGDRDVTLWQQALTYFAQQRDLECRQHIVKVLAHIDKHNLLPPLLVIQLLSRNSSATLAVVKDYLLRRIREEADVIKKHEESISNLRAEAEKTKSRIADLKTGAIVFQETKCSLCNHDLELPAIHFLCQHAYHQHCLESYAESEDECPVCAGKNRKILDNIREQEQVLLSSAALHEQFTSQLKKSRDGFGVVADFFSKGVFNKVTLVGDAEVGSRAPPGGASHRIDPSLQKELLMMQQANMT